MHQRHHGSSSGSASKVPQSRAMSPAGNVMQQVASQGAHPARATSAPRVAGYGCGSSVRTASHHLQVGTPAVAPPGQPQPQCGQPSPAMLTGGYPMRSKSPASVGMVGGGMPVNLRNTINHLPGHPRTASPVGLAPSSPTGSGCLNGAVALGSLAAAPGSHVSEGHPSTNRGRSPPPTMAAQPGAGPLSVRAPRAFTPSTIVKGIAQGMHAGGMVHRNSLGGAPLVVQR